MTYRLRDLTPYDLYTGLSALGISPSEAVRDPVLAMRHAACCASLEDAERFLRAVLVGEVPSLEMMEEDEARLLVCGVLARVLTVARQIKRGGFSVGGPLSGPLVR